MMRNMLEQRLIVSKVARIVSQVEFRYVLSSFSTKTNAHTTERRGNDELQLNESHLNMVSPSHVRLAALHYL